MIVLVGMPGSGKSSAGRQVARRFGLPFIDSDHLIESDIGMPIKDYFAQQGEEAFRDLETATLRRIAEVRPRSLPELDRVGGLGPARLDRFGETFLDICSEG